MTNPSPQRNILGFPRVVLLLSLLASVTAYGARFDIPSQSLSSALQLFIKQSGKEVIYPFDDVRKLTAKPVVGEFEPQAALERLLLDSGFTARQTETNQFVIARTAVEKPGSIEGQVRDESGKPVPGARVSLAGSERSFATDRRGRFVLEGVPAGAQVLQIFADGMQKTKVTDVIVRSNHHHTLGAITIPAIVAGITQLEDYVVSAKKNDGVVQLDPYEVEGRRAKPFVDGNLDIPRTIDDAQPYFVFNAKMIDNSGAVNLEDFLKQRLPMNTVAQTNAQLTDPGDTWGSSVGATSSINLRGLGAESTLILINGRRMSGVTSAGGGMATNSELQPDLNGIPLSAIERVEVLPTSASGIYGGGAIGGVVNVILKKNYQGGEVRATYDNLWGKEAARRTVSASYGMSLEGGKSHLSFNASWSDAKPFLFRHRLDEFRNYLATVQANAPTYITSATNPWMGVLPNIAPTSSAVTGLTFDDGTPLNSRITHVPQGLGPDATFAEIKAALLANAGTHNLDFPDTVQSPVGLRREVHRPFETRSAGLDFTRNMTHSLDLHASFAYSQNDSSAMTAAVSDITVPAGAPSNPFQQTVRIRVPTDQAQERTTSTASTRFNVGLLARLPRDWTATVDYGWSETKHDYTHIVSFSPDLSPALQAGTINPFVDPQLYPTDWFPYALTVSSAGSNQVQEWSARGSGPLFGLPWGDVTIVTGAGHRITDTPSRALTNRYLSRPNGPHPATRIYYPRDSAATSGYAELTIPLLAERRLPFLYALEAQVSGRIESFSVSTGTIGYRIDENVSPPAVVNYMGETLNGVPQFSKADYSSSHYTFGLKHRVTKDLTLRVSQASAFIPPTPDQLAVDPEPSDFNVSVFDPVSGVDVSVPYLVGGRADLKPQNSTSVNAGAIWTPEWRGLQGLRINVEYFRIRQRDAIRSLPPQEIVNRESSYPDRVVRDANGTIVLLDRSLMNLYEYETDGWDLNVNYSRASRWGAFDFRASHSIISSLKSQFSLLEPAYDAAGFHPGEGGAPKFKGNVGLNWERDGWNAGWSLRYVDSYKQYGAAGGPVALQTDPSGAAIPTWLVRQGGDTIEAQSYHDIHLSYSTGTEARGFDAPRGWRAWVAGMTFQIGVRNLFDKVPPLDARYLENSFFSPYGETRPRSYWISVKKAY